MEQRISLITLGVKNLQSAKTFYEKLDWVPVPSEDGICVFQLNGQCLGLYDLNALADDIGVPVDTLGQGAATLGYNTRTLEDVGQILSSAEKAGGRILKPAQDVFWGGHHGYFADPEGHIWEVAYNPFSPLRGKRRGFCVGRVRGKLIQILD